MRHTTVVIVVVLAAACTPPGSPPDDQTGRPGVAPAIAWHLDVLEPPDTPQPDIEQPAPMSDLRPPSSDLRSLGETTAESDIEQAAADRIIRRLETEELYVLDLTTDIEDATGKRAVVLVAVVHGTGESHPTETRYRVTLVRSASGWQVTGVESAP